MSQRAIEFVETWVSENITATGDDTHAGNPAAGNPQAGDFDGDNPAADNPAVKALAAQCLKAAGAEGIPLSEIQDTFEDLAAFIAGEIAEANERAADSEDEDDAEDD